MENEGRSISSNVLGSSTVSSNHIVDLTEYDDDTEFRDTELLLIQGDHHQAIASLGRLSGQGDRGGPAHATAEETPSSSACPVAQTTDIATGRSSVENGASSTQAGTCKRLRKEELEEEESHDVCIICHEDFDNQGDHKVIYLHVLDELKQCVCVCVCLCVRAFVLCVYVCMCVYMHSLSLSLSLSHTHTHTHTHTGGVSCMWAYFWRRLYKQMAGGTESLPNLQQESMCLISFVFPHI
jgi:hypothetical protein